MVADMLLMGCLEGVSRAGGGAATGLIAILGLGERFGSLERARRWEEVAWRGMGDMLCQGEIGLERFQGERRSEEMAGGACAAALAGV